MHDGKETTIIKRPSEREKGEFVYCYKNDRDQTIPKEEAEEMIKKTKTGGSGKTEPAAGGGEGKTEPAAGKGQKESLKQYIKDKLILS